MHMRCMKKGEATQCNLLITSLLTQKSNVAISLYTLIKGVPHYKVGRMISLAPPMEEEETEGGGGGGGGGGKEGEGGLGGGGGKGGGWRRGQAGPALRMQSFLSFLCSVYIPFVISRRQIGMEEKGKPHHDERAWKSHKVALWRSEAWRIQSPYFGIYGFVTRP